MKLHSWNPNLDGVDPATLNSFHGDEFEQCRTALHRSATTEACDTIASGLCDRLKILLIVAVLALGLAIDNGILSSLFKPNEYRFGVVFGMLFLFAVPFWLPDQIHPWLARRLRRMCGPAKRR